MRSKKFSKINYEGSAWGMFKSKCFCIISVMFLVMVMSLSYTTRAEAGATIQREYVSIEKTLNNNVNGRQNAVTRYGSQRIRVHFAYVNLEDGEDFMWLGHAEPIARNPITGYKTNFWSDWVYGEKYWVLISTNYQNQSSYKIDIIEYENSPVTKQSPDFTKSWTGLNFGMGLSGYEDNTFYSASLTTEFPAQQIRVHFREINVEQDYDFVLTSAGDRYTGHFYDVWSSWMDGTTFWCHLLSDYSISPSNGGYIIDKVEIKYYAGSHITSDGWHCTCGWTGDNPHANDGLCRFCNGYDFRPANAWATFGENPPTITGYVARFTKLNFMWDSYLLRNLQLDGNEAMEVELDFYNYGGVYGYAWMVPDSSDSPLVVADTIWETNQPAAYLDTHFADNADEISFSAGVYDASRYNANQNYYWKIWGSKGLSDVGKFKVLAQRSYKYGGFPNMAYNVFASEHEATGNSVFLKRFIPGFTEDAVEAPNTWTWNR